MKSYNFKNDYSCTDNTIEGNNCIFSNKWNTKTPPRAVYDPHTMNVIDSLDTMCYDTFLFTCKVHFIYTFGS